MKFCETTVSSDWREFPRSIRAVPSLSDSMELMKARLSMMVVLTTAFGLWLGAGANQIDGWLTFWTLLGTGLVAGGAAAMNQVFERDYDALMERTRNRPLPSRRVEVRAAILLSLLTTALGLITLAVFVNTLSMLLAGLTWLVYVAIYTPMKRCTSACTLLGGITGALPPLIGWAAATDSLSIGAWLLFGILFLWQMPHFLAINWMYRRQYEEAGYAMWCNGDEGGQRTGWLSVLFLTLLVVVSLLAANWFGGEAWRTLLAGALSITFLGTGIDFLASPDRTKARRLFFASLIFLPLMLTALILGASL